MKTEVREYEGERFASYMSEDRMDVYCTVSQSISLRRGEVIWGAPMIAVTGRFYHLKEAGEFRAAFDRAMQQLGEWDKDTHKMYVVTE